ncbi:MAG: hypothetical protein JKY93_03395 [Gammaproteobacteria bacterium]|nr:hypothetical protein [Gammaproteobacteria bacterium]
MAFDKSADQVWVDATDVEKQDVRDWGLEVEVLLAEMSKGTATTPNRVQAPDDLDDLTSYSDSQIVYWTTSPPANVPFGYGLCICLGGTFPSQLAVGSGGNEIASRVHQGGVWGAWRMYLGTNDFATNAQAVGGTNSTKVMTPQRVKAAIDANVAVGWGYTSPETTISQYTTHTFTHGLGAKPTKVCFDLVCVTAEHGFPIGHTIPNLTHAGYHSSHNGYQVGIPDDTTVNVLIGSYIHALSETSKQAANLTLANWKIVMKASL